jgi:hypothetical protein
MGKRFSKNLLSGNKILPAGDFPTSTSGNNPVIAPTPMMIRSAVPTIKLVAKPLIARWVKVIMRARSEKERVI